MTQTVLNIVLVNGPDEVVAEVVVAESVATGSCIIGTFDDDVPSCGTRTSVGIGCSKSAPTGMRRFCPSASAYNPDPGTAGFAGDMYRSGSQLELATGADAEVVDEYDIEDSSRARSIGAAATPVRARLAAKRPATTRFEDMALVKE